MSKKTGLLAYNNQKQVITPNFIVFIIIASVKKIFKFYENLLKNNNLLKNIL